METQDSQFQVGQQWHYQTRPQEIGSTFNVVKTEHYPNIGNVIHISVAGLKIANAHHPSGTTETASHLPFLEEALAQSATDLVAQNAPVSDDYREGYEQWKAAFDAGKAGAWGIALAEAVEAMESALQAR